VPLAPTFSGHAVGVAAVSYDGEVTFGLDADRATVPDLDVLKGGIEESLADLRHLAGPDPGPVEARNHAAQSKRRLGLPAANPPRQRAFGYRGDRI
jgi:hypothetical protein